MNPHTEQLIANTIKRIQELELENKMLQEECAALREQINELQ